MNRQTATENDAPSRTRERRFSRALSWQAAIALIPLAQGFLLALALGLGVGLANCWLFAVSKTWEIAWGIISRPLFLISCVFFSFHSLPGFARDILWFNPLIHLAGLLRAGFYPAYDAGHVSTAYVTVIALVLILGGLFAIRTGRARLAAP